MDGEIPLKKKLSFKIAQIDGGIPSNTSEKSKNNPFLCITGNFPLI